MANLIQKMIDKVEPDENERGNKVYRLHIGSGERYDFDFEICTPAEGWKQYDTSQDAWYFGVWVHVEKRLTVTYAEGDVTVVVCPTLETFRAELADAEEFYGDPPPAFKVIDADGKITHYFDERPTA